MSSGTIIYLVSVFFYFTTSCFAQPDKLLAVNDTSKIINTKLNNYYAFYIDATGKQTVTEVSKQPFDIPIFNLDSVSRKYRNKVACCWVRIALKNYTGKHIRMILLASGTDGELVYIYQKERYSLLGNSDVLFTRKPTISRSSFPFVSGANEEVILYICIKNQYHKLYRTNYLLNVEDEGGYLLGTESQVKKYIDNTFLEDLNYNVKQYSFLSIIFFIFLYTLIQYLINKKKEFLWYSFYCFSIFCLFLYKANQGIYMSFPFGYFPRFMAYANYHLWYLMYFMYLKFIQHFVGSKRSRNMYYKTSIYGQYFIILCCAADLILLFMFNDQIWRSGLFTLSRIVLMVLSTIVVYLVFHGKRSKMYFLAWGLLVLGFSGILSILSEKLNLFWFLSYVYPITYIKAGIILELICFAIGINYKFYQDEQQKNSAQNLLIARLEENKELQHKLNFELEEMVLAQTQQIINQREELEKQKERELQSRFLSKISLMELQLLRSQLNPHFYFNTLNNLYGLTLIDPSKAPDAILKLSSIMEYVIYDCKNDKVTLTKELGFLKNYIELEKLRYENAANIFFDAQGESEGKFISPLLLIQFVENAFKHGLEPQKSIGTLQVQIDIADNMLRFTCKNSYDPKPVRKEGIGLNNVMKRLQMLYPYKHAILFNAQEHLYSVELSIELD